MAASTVASLNYSNKLSKRGQKKCAKYPKIQFPGNFKIRGLDFGVNFSTTVFLYAALA
jgi:hypothetical protein